MDMNTVLAYSGRPTLFERGTDQFWVDPHIATHLLNAHLDPAEDAASRRPAVIEKTIKWIHGLLPPQSEILDLGCGPGLYAERLAALGHRVTGLDFSENSIAYASRTAQDKGLPISYRVQNYLTLDEEGQYDTVLLIYCDFGALINTERDELLKRIHRALKPGGQFIFDVFTDGFPADHPEGQSWEVSENGFWSPRPHLVLTETFHYSEAGVVLNQHLVLEEACVKVYRIYDHYYSEAEVRSLLASFGFGSVQCIRGIIEESNFGSAAVQFITAKKD